MPPGPLRAHRSTPQEGQRQTPPQAPQSYPGTPQKAQRQTPPQVPPEGPNPGAGRLRRWLAGLWDGRGRNSREEPLGLASGEVFSGAFRKQSMSVPGPLGPCPPSCSVYPSTGIIGNVYLNDSPLKKFRIYSLEMDRSFLQRSVPPCGSRGAEEAARPAPPRPGVPRTLPQPML